MSATSSMQGSRVESGTARLEQVYFTHCMPGDSVRGDAAGYNIRATSTRDPALLEFVFKYTAYELPLDMWGLSPTTAEAPRRLALMAAPNGYQAIVRTSYLPTDTRGRKHSYFSHFLFCQGVTAAEALASWDTVGPEGWQEIYPEKASKDLEPLKRLPRPGTLTPKAVTDFLKGASATPTKDLDSVTAPARLPRDPESRRLLLQKVLLGCLEALRLGSADVRGRFYLLAEPGLAALLFYACSQLLPHKWARQLTFSTFENMHSALKPYRHAQLIASYTTNVQRGLDPDFFTARGYGVDTFNDQKFSPELRNAPRRFSDLLRLAEQGDWVGVQDARNDKLTFGVQLVRDVLGADADSYDRLGDVFDDFERAGRLKQGPPQKDDLIALEERSDWGKRFLAEWPRTWATVKALAPANEDVQKTFLPLLQKNLKELERDVVEALTAGDPTAWGSRWAFYGLVVQKLGGDVRKAFEQTLPAPTANGQAPLRPTLRLPLLREWYRLNPTPAPQTPPTPPAIAWLLSTASDGELNDLWVSNLPEGWVNQALLSALLMRGSPIAVELLRTAEEARVGTFVQAARGQYGSREDLREKVLLPLFQGASAEQVARLLRLGVSGTPAHMLKLMNAAGAFAPTWDAVWRGEQMLKLLFESMKDQGGAPQAIWAHFTDKITEDVVVKGDANQRSLLDRLEEVRLAQGAVVPPSTDETIRDWMTLRRHFDPSYNGPPAPPRELHLSCERRGLKFFELLREDFETFVLPQGQKVIGRFERTFHGFLPPDLDDWPNIEQRWLLWLKVVSVCPDPNLKADYQIYYLEQHIAPQYHLALAQDAYNKKKIEKKVWKKVEAEEVARQEEEQRRKGEEERAVVEERRRRAAHDATAAKQEEAKETMRAQRRARRSGTGLKIAVWCSVALLGVGGAVLGIYLLNSGKPPTKDNKPLKDSTVKNKDRDNDKDKERDTNKDKDKDLVVKDTNGTKDGHTWPQFEGALDFVTKPVETLLDAFIEEADSSQGAAGKIKAYDLASDFNKVRLALKTRKNEVLGLNLNSPNTPSEWKSRTAELTKIVNGPLWIRVADAKAELRKIVKGPLWFPVGDDLKRDEAVKSLITLYWYKQKELYETIRKQNTSTKTQGKDEKQILTDLLTPLPAPAIAAFVEQYGREHCKLDPKFDPKLDLKGMDAVRSLLASYVQADAFFNSLDPEARKSVDGMKLQTIRDLLIFYVRTEALLKGKQDPTEAKKRLKDVFIANNAREVWENMAPNRKGLIKTFIETAVRELEK